MRTGSAMWFSALSAGTKIAAVCVLIGDPMAEDSILESISAEALAAVCVCVVLFSVLMYAAFYVSAYQERCKALDKLKIKERSGISLTETEKIAVEAGKTFQWGVYGVAALIGALATMGISFIIVLMIGDYYSIGSTLYYGAVAIIATVAVAAVLDYFAVHPVADGEFYAKVVRPLNEEFLAPAGEAAAKKASLTSEEAQFAKKLFELLSAAKDDGKE